MISISSRRASAASRTTLATVRALARPSAATMTSPTPRMTRIGRVQPRQPASGRSGRRRRRASPSSALTMIVDRPPEPACARAFSRTANEAGNGLRSRLAAAAPRSGKSLRELAPRVLLRQSCTDSARPLFVSIVVERRRLLRRRVVAQVDRELGGVAPARRRAAAGWR